VRIFLELCRCWRGRRPKTRAEMQLSANRKWSTHWVRGGRRYTKVVKVLEKVLACIVHTNRRKRNASRGSDQDTCCNRFRGARANAKPLLHSLGDGCEELAAMQGQSRSRVKPVLQRRRSQCVHLSPNMA